jgi:cysteine desulfurase/selenocysteine lyase
VSRPADASARPDVREARSHFPATDTWAYFNTAAVGLGSRALAAAYHEVVDAWTADGLDYGRGDAAAETARASVAGLLGAHVSDVALIASVSAAAGLVAAQFGPAERGHNVVIGEHEYSSNHFPWRLLAGKGYDVRQVPFRNGGLEPDEVAAHIDGGTQLVAFSAVQTATGHRSDITAISGLAHAVGAIVFVDGSQMIGAMPVGAALESVDVLVTSDHKFLLNAGRGVGYCYLSRAAQDRFTPINAGWRAARTPYQSFFGPTMDLSPTASRFDSPVSWLAAIGDAAALSVFDTYGAEAVYERNQALTIALREALTDIGWTPTAVPEEDNQSTIVSVPLPDTAAADLADVLRRRGVVCSVRQDRLRLAVHFYNDEQDVRQVADALAGLGT